MPIAVKLRLPLLVALAGLALATSACTSSPEPASSTVLPTTIGGGAVVTPTATPQATDDSAESTPEPDSATYATVDELKKALVAAGQSCSSYTVVKTVAKATGAATCGSKFTIAVFASAADRDEVVNTSAAKDVPDLMLVGANWLLIPTSQSQDLTALQLKLGGFIVPQGS